MKNNDRWNQIVQLVDQRGFLSIHELSQLCHTSVMTIRRDLTQLHAADRIRRTHGGAASLRVQPSPTGQLAAVDDDEKPETSPFDHLDALISTDSLPKFVGLNQRADHKGCIPLIAESIQIPGAVTCVMVDNFQAGFDLGCWAGRYALERRQGNVQALDLTYHRPNTQARSQGFLAGLRDMIPSAQVLVSVNAQSRYDMAYQLVRDALSVHPHINTIFAVNDTSALGAYRACKDLGIASDRLIILTFGVEGPTMLDLIQKSDLVRAGLAMFPEITGIVCVEAAIAACAGQPLPSQLTTPHCLVTQENLSTIYEKTPSGWRLHWQGIPCDVTLPMPVDAERPDRNRPLPERLGFIYTYAQHEWYRTLTKTMTDYAGRLGIRLQIVDYEKTVKDELQLRRNEIARRAAAEVKAGDTIFIDAGPMSGPLSEQLLSHKGITVITHSMPVIEILKEGPADITLISTGGAYRRSSQVFVGPTAETTLKEFRIDKLFLMVSGISRKYDLYHTNISEVTMKQQMIRSAREVILLADYNCFQQEGLVQVMSMSVVHKVISDDALPASVRLELGTLGISVILAAMEQERGTNE